MNKQPFQTTIDPEVLEEVKKLTVARLRALSREYKISVGNTDYSQEEIIDHVEEGDEIGTQMMAMQLEFLQDLASGDLYQYG